MPDTQNATIPNTTDGWAAAGAAVLQQDTAQQIRNNITNNSGKSADQAAEYQHLAQFVNVPVDVVHQDPDMVKAQAAAQRVDADTVASTSPKTANYLTDANNAAKSHDDVHALTGVEAAVRALPAPQKPAPSFVDQTLDFLGENLKSLVSAPGSVSAPAELGKGFAGAINKAAGAVNLVAGAFPTMYDKAASVLTGKQTTSASDYWFRKMVDPRMNAQAALEVAPTAPFAAKVGSTAGNLLGMIAEVVGTGGGGAAVKGATSAAGMAGEIAAHGAKAMAFPAVTDAVTTAKNVYAQTGDLNHAIQTAQAQYLTTTMAGVVPLGVPGSAMARAATGFVSGATVGEVGRNAMNMVLPSSMAQPFDLEGTILSGLAGAGLGAALGPRAEPAYNDAMRQAQMNADRADRAKQGADAIQLLGELATSSKTRDRDPAAFRQLVQDMTENGQLQDVYISAKDLGDVLNQSGVTPEQLAAKLPDVAAQIQEATMTNGDVRIPVEDYATHIAGGPVDAAMLPHLKTDAEGMTFKEAQDHFAGQQDSMRETADKIGADQERAAARQADGQGVHDDVLAQLNQLKRFNPDVNKQYAALMRAFFETQGERHGMTAREVYEMSGLNIKGQPVVDGLDQSSLQDAALRRYDQTLAEAENWMQSNGYNANLRSMDPAVAHTTLDQMMGVGMAGLSESAKTQGRAIWDRVDAAHERLDRFLSPEKYAPVETVNVKPPADVATWSDSTKGYWKPQWAKFKKLAKDGKVTEADIARMESFMGDPGRAPSQLNTLTAEIRKRPAPGDDLLHQSSRVDPDTGLPLNSDGTVTVYHHTSKANADAIRKSGILKAQAEPDVYVTTHPDTDTGYGDTALPIRVDPKKLMLDDEFPSGRQDFRMDAGKPGGSIKVKVDDQFNQANRGGYNPETATLALLKAADLSTFLHESGHFFLEATTTLASRPGATDGMRADSLALLGHLGIEGTPEMAPLDRWAMMDINEKRAAHEQFAEGFEKYLMEGKAPTIELQGLFSRFRSWLLNVYKSLAGLNVELAPEVRGIMDRMLASDEAIREAEQTRSFRTLFDNTDDSAAGREVFEKYQVLGARATEEAIADMTGRSMRDMQWSSNAKSKAIKALQKDAASKRRVIQDQVEKEVRAQPIEQARQFLKDGKLFDVDGNELPDTRPLDAPAPKLDAAAIAEMFPKDALGNPDLTKLRGLTTKEGLDPDIAAEMFGIRDGHELVRQLTEARPVKDQVRELTDQRMLEQFGELTDAAHIEQAANESVHNETRARFVATGLKMLSKSPIPVRQLVKAAREAAEASINGKRIRDLRPTQYLAAESRSNKDALELAPRDPAGAVQAQRAALLNNQLFRVADGAVRDIQKSLKYLARFDKENTRAKIDLEYREQIDALLDRHDLRKSVSGKALDKREALSAFVERMAAAGLEPNVPERLLNEAQLIHYKDMTVEEFGGLVDAVKSIEHLGRLKTEILDGQERRAIDALADEAVNKMATLPQRGPESNRGLSRIGELWLGTKAAGRSLQASLLKMEQMIDWLDGRDANGVMNRVVFRRIADAGVKEYELQAKVKAGIDELLHAHLNDVTKNGKKIFIADNLIDAETGMLQRFTKKEMLALAGNMGNESNIKKLAAGEKWNEQHVWDFLHANMTKADWDFVAGMGKAMESLWPEKLAMSRRLGNTNPDKIAPRPFDTPHGHYEGWYWPMVYDAARDQGVADRGAKAGADLFENTYSRANTDTGRTITRNENYAAPVLLSLDVVPRVLKDEIHDIAYREAIIDADKFIANKKVRDGIVSALSQQHYDQLRPWLQSIANDSKVDMAALKWFDRVAHGARTRATIVGLGYRVSTMLVHGSSAAMESIAEVGPVWMTKAMGEFATKPFQIRDFVYSRSGEMKNRMNEVDRDIREHLREIDLRLMDPATSVVQRGSDLMKAHAYWGIAMLDMASALPTWMAAYHKGLSPESKGGKNLSEADAIYFADKTVRNAHGGSGAKDMAAVQRGPEFFKLFTMFYTFWNHNANRLMDTARLAGQLPETYRTGAPGEFQGDLGRVIMRTLIYTIGVQTMHHMLHPKKDEEGDTNWAAYAAKEFTASAFAGIPILRDLSAHYLTGKDYSATPAAGMVDAIGHSGNDALNAMAGKEVSDKWVKHSVTSAGYVFALPLGQPASATQFLYNVQQGKEHPENVSDWAKGLMRGDLKKH